MNTLRPSILLADDHQIVRFALKEIIRKLFSGTPVLEVSNKFELDKFIEEKKK